METQGPLKRICIVGNIGSGKTTLARKIARHLNLPVYPIDQIQFRRDLSIRDLKDIRRELAEVEKGAAWIIDGYGPLEMLNGRFQKADLLIFIDPPVGINLLLLTFRQIKNIFFPRAELPAGSSELNWRHIKKIYRTLWSMHKKMRPELIRLLHTPDNRRKLITLPSSFGVQIFKIQSRFEELVMHLKPLDQQDPQEK